MRSTTTSRGGGWWGARGCWAAACAALLGGAHAEPFEVAVVERDSRWPVPLVELRTTNGVSFVTDNAGVVAVDAPELLGREVWFAVRSPSYSVAPDAFGYRGVRLQVEPGGRAEVEVGRELPARRLGRLTGGGLFAESQKLGRFREVSEPGVFGCDSVQLAFHRGRLVWLWGDTVLPHYPLGVFHMTGATTPRFPLAEAKPPLNLGFDLMRGADGRPRPLAQMDDEDGPTWLNALASLPTDDGAPRLVATFTKIRNALEPYRIGLCVWDESGRRFLPHKVLWEHSGANPEPPLTPQGHPVLWTDDEGVQWLMFGDPFPTIKMRATFEAWQDPDSWQPVDAPRELESADGNPVKVHRGSIAWHPSRKRWVAIFTQLGGGGPSHLGEVWYCEAPAPTGPWGAAVKVLSHENYSFYNPRIHTDLSRATSGDVLLFEGTYSAMFSSAAASTPRYDYNQILYRIDLDDPALAPARGR